METGFAAVLLAAVQAAPAAAPVAPRPPAMLTPEQPQLAQRRVVEDCPEAAGSDIVVCGRRGADARYRLPAEAPSAAGPDTPRNVLGFRISDNVSGQIDPVQYELPNGMVARGIVARVKVAF